MTFRLPVPSDPPYLQKIRKWRLSAFNRKSVKRKTFPPAANQWTWSLAEAKAEFYDMFQQFVLRDKGLFPGTYVQMADTKHEIHAKKKHQTNELSSYKLVSKLIAYHPHSKSILTRTVSSILKPMAGGSNLCSVLSWSIETWPTATLKDEHNQRYPPILLSLFPYCVPIVPQKFFLSSPYMFPLFSYYIIISLLCLYCFSTFSPLCP